MDTVTIDGVEYVKASVLAKQHKYTNDYIGQLCRGKKVDAHLVGRTWYVYPPSLEGHKSSRYAELRSGENTIQNSLIKSSSRRDVLSPLSKKTTKSQSPHFHDRVFWKNPQYADDHADLLPLTAKDVPSPTKMRVGLADGHSVRVASVSKNVTLITQPMPAVALAGTLKVLNYAPKFDHVSDEPAVASEYPIENYSDIGTFAEDVPADEPDLTYPDEHSSTKGRRLHTTAEKEDKASARVTYPVAIKKEFAAIAGHSSRTSRVAATSQVSDALTITPTRLQSHDNDPKATSMFFRLVVAPAVILLTVVVAGALFTLESVTSVGSAGQEVVSWRFNTAAVSTFLVPW